MTPAHAYAGPSNAASWFTRATDWLDARGKGAWIATMVLGFIFFWPVGLAILAYVIWSKRMFSGESCARSARSMAPTRFRGSGNVAFDSYKADMLRRLEDEQEAFETFLQRLREAKDKAEFDQFMEDRQKRTDAETGDDKDAA
ncbi:Protein of unknown function [Jannaschia faecimaris]|uniref:DUF2852 domain-containing protein n=1 Tax=Jannaschia faecimaris TaxID=1244108 RepID=A0A1H3P201_9RHOB|nr:DUF2852 domain-containing protein [Jannaschia faecimaris]SDY95060.1 Protein of unknown function [Jannaschia faecimaris]